ncbi:uncharacterized protein LOC111877457 [Lactuca sativa]|uniref:uncharacterized protein LOC111877457 n=1 Tax=Lactuca sativa TaxID=4236 RepID=UPI000CD8E884|nr:uncharacterized protein LOC111877457 [Lactuca sativa]
MSHLQLIINEYSMRLVREKQGKQPQQCMLGEKAKGLLPLLISPETEPHPGGYSWQGTKKMKGKKGAEISSSISTAKSGFNGGFLGLDLLEIQQLTMTRKIQ